MPQYKQCIRCKETKRLAFFYPKTRKHAKGPSGRVSMCKDCCNGIKTSPNKKLITKNSQLKAKYGITILKRAEMSEAQGDSCAICEKHESQLTKCLAVDHCHKTGKVRKLLCTSCNTKLGVVENIEFLEKAKKYLKETVGSPNADSVYNINQGVISTVQSNKSN